MITFQEENWLDVHDEVTQHWPDHYLEAYGDDDFSPNLAQFDALAAAGVYFVVTARRGSELIGYATFFVQPHPLQQSVLWGSFDSYYVQPAARAPRVALRLLQATEAAMQRHGATKILANEFSRGRLFASLGYRAAERVYVKELA